MKRIAAVLIFFSLYVTAEPWDGKRGSLQLFTMETRPEPLWAMGFPTATSLTWFYVLADDPSVNEVIVTIEFRDQFGNLKTDRRVGTLPPNGPWIVTIFPIRTSQIIGGPHVVARTVRTLAEETFTPKP